MRKIGTVLAAVTATVLIVGTPLLAHASVFVARDSYSTTAQDRINDNLYVTGGTVMIGSEVAGDLAMFGGMLTLTGHVQGDLAAGGGNIQILGPVSGDVRVGGGQVSINERIGGELLVLGGTVNVLSNAVIKGDLTVLGGQVIIDGSVEGNVRYTGGRLTINGAVLGNVNAKVSQKLVVGPDARISGALDYKSPSEAQIAEGAVLGGKVTYEPTTQLRVTKDAPRAALWAVLGVLTAIRTLALLGVVLLAVWLWRRPALGVIQEASDKFWSSLGRGLVYLILVPIAAILLMVSFIGLIPGILLALVFTMVIIVAKVLAAIFLGAWIWSMLKKRQATLQITWLNAIVGLLVLEIVGLVPVIGWLVQFVIFLIIFGVLATRAQKAIV